MLHPFGELLQQFRRRKRGLSQQRLAHMIGYDEAILSRMVNGSKDLTGPAARGRVIQIIHALHAEGVLMHVVEANALLAAATLPPLYSGLSTERQLLALLNPKPSPDFDNAHEACYRVPASVSSFIGREAQVDELTLLLGRTRLVTLTGPGGSGKTRLAIETAQGIERQFQHGACFVPLVSLGNVDEFKTELAHCLQLSIAPGDDSFDDVLRFLRTRHLLLLLDNFEHILGAAGLVSDLLAAAPRVTVLVTSREPLHLSGEHVIAVAPLSLPPDVRDGSSASVQEVYDAASVQLFVERARALQVEFPITPAAASLVASICHALDGLPLAIELAAARMREFTLLELATALGALQVADPKHAAGHLSVLINGPRDAPARHRTLRDTIDWSYALLSEQQRQVLRCVAVFVGGAAPQQIAQVSGIGMDQLLPRLGDLTRASMIREERLANGTRRFHMLELVRAFALERLSAANLLQHVQKKLAEAMAMLGEAALWPMRGSGQGEWTELLKRDYGNCRVALAWCFAHGGDAVLGCRIVGGWMCFWYVVSSYVADCIFWLDRALAIPATDLPGRVRADVLISLCLNNPPNVAAREVYAREAVAAYEVEGEPRDTALAMFVLGQALSKLNPMDSAWKTWVDQGVTIARRIGNDWLEGLGWLVRGIAADDNDENTDAEIYYRNMLAGRRRSGNLADISVGLWQLGAFLIKMRRFEEAVPLLRESINICAAQGNAIDEVVARHQLGEALQQSGKLAEAVAELDVCANVAHARLPLRYGIRVLLCLGRALCQHGDRNRARDVFDTAAGIAISSDTNEWVWADQYVNTARCTLCRDNFRRAAQIRQHLADHAALDHLGATNSEADCRSQIAMAMFEAATNDLRR